MTTVLVLDANQRSALAATRSLGRAGYRVVTGDAAPATLAGCSRYAAATVVYPDPAAGNTDQFLGQLEKLVREQAVDVLLPMGEITSALVLRHRKDFAPAIVVGPSADSFDAVCDKDRVMGVARDLGIAIPESVLVTTAQNAAALADRLGFPVVLKPIRSRFETINGWSGASVVHAASREEVEQLVAAHSYLRAAPFLLQRRVQGHGVGVFLLHHDGHRKVAFCHRRLREKPPSGGVAVLCESIPPQAALIEQASKLLKHFTWDGVAMVEFKQAPDGTAYLMEINGRFWGSLQLAVDAGVDFPRLAVAAAMGVDVTQGVPYREGVRSRWLLGDLDHLLLRLRGKRLEGAPPMSRGRALLQFVIPARNSRQDVLRLSDLRPFLHEAGSYATQLLRARRQGR